MVENLSLSRKDAVKHTLQNDFRLIPLAHVVRKLSAWKCASQKIKINREADL